MKSRCAAFGVNKAGARFPSPQPVTEVRVAVPFIEMRMAGGSRGGGAAVQNWWMFTLAMRLRLLCGD